MQQESLYTRIPADLMVAINERVQAERRTKKEVIIKALKLYLETPVAEKA